jgi:hypothetical protein
MSVIWFSWSEWTRVKGLLGFLEYNDKIRGFANRLYHRVGARAPTGSVDLAPHIQQDAGEDLGVDTVLPQPREHVAIVIDMAACDLQSFDSARVVAQGTTRSPRRHCASGFPASRQRRSRRNRYNDNHDGGSHLLLFTASRLRCKLSMNLCGSVAKRIALGFGLVMVVDDGISAWLVPLGTALDQDPASCGPRV